MLITYTFTHTACRKSITCTLICTLFCSGSLEYEGRIEFRSGTMCTYTGDHTYEYVVTAERYLMGSNGGGYRMSMSMICFQ